MSELRRRFVVGTVNSESVGSSVDEINIQQQKSNQKSLQSNHKNQQLTIEPSTINSQQLIINQHLTIKYQQN